MDLQELRSKTSEKVLIRGPSGSGKTLNAVKIALEVLKEGYNVRFVDLESEGSGTFIKVIDDPRGIHGDEYGEDIVDNLEYVEVDSYDGFQSSMTGLNNIDLLIMDPMDHKHTYVLKEVANAKTKADADWNEYPQIYSEEKNIMSTISDMDTHVVCTLDPESGKKDKPKGAQTNIHGYFGILVDVFRQGDSWSHKIDNWLGRSDLVGGELNNVEVHKAISSEILENLE